jgi:hypothetical protein
MTMTTMMTIVSFKPASKTTMMMMTTWWKALLLLVKKYDRLESKRDSIGYPPFFCRRCCGLQKNGGYPIESHVLDIDCDGFILIFFRFGLNVKSKKTRKTKKARIKIKNLHTSKSVCKHLPVPNTFGLKKRLVRLPHCFIL